MEGDDALSVRTTIKRPWTAYPLSLAERVRGREANIDYFMKFLDRATLEEVFKLSDVPEKAPAFFGIDVDACGRLWVLRSSSYMEAPATFDVLSDSGAPLGTVTLAAHLFSDEGWAVGRNRLIAILRNEDEAPAVGVYRLPEFSGCQGT